LSAESHITNPDDAIVAFLDPRNDCPHHWVWWYESMFGGLRPPMSYHKAPPYRAIFGDDPPSDVKAFLKELPDCRRRILERLQNRYFERNLDAWLSEEYWSWKQKEGSSVGDCPGG
jgi:hypothetical protein